MSLCELCELYRSCKSYKAFDLSTFSITEPFNQRSKEPKEAQPTEKQDGAGQYSQSDK